MTLEARGDDGEVLDQIRLTGVRATGYHGVLASERAAGQEFVVDLVVHLDARSAAVGDDLARTVDYGVLAERVVDTIESDPADLIETVAERLAAVALSEPAVQAVDVVLHKPHAPITVPFGDVAVAIRRSRVRPPVVVPVTALGADAVVRDAVGDEAADRRPAADHLLGDTDRDRADRTDGTTEPGAGVSAGVAAAAAAAAAVAAGLPPVAVPPVAVPSAAAVPVPAAPGAEGDHEPVGDDLTDTAVSEPFEGLPDADGHAADSRSAETLAAAQPDADPRVDLGADPLEAAGLESEPSDASDDGIVAAPVEGGAAGADVPAAAHDDDVEFEVEPLPIGDALRERDRMDEIPASPVDIVLALGANVGDTQQTLRDAITVLDAIDGIEVVDVSPLARTAAVGGPEQDDYLNAVVVARTDLSARELLHAVQDVERSFGRERTVRWGPRTLDVDIIVYGTLADVAEDLELPHPRAHERAFVLEPWSQVQPDAVLPGLGGGPVAQLAATAPDRTGIRWLALDWLGTEEPEPAAAPDPRSVATPAPVPTAPAEGPGTAGRQPASAVPAGAQPASAAPAPAVVPPAPAAVPVPPAPAAIPVPPAPAAVPPPGAPSSAASGTGPVRRTSALHQVPGAPSGRTFPPAPPADDATRVAEAAPTPAAPIDAVPRQFAPVHGTGAQRVRPAQDADADPRTGLPPTFRPTFPAVRQSDETSPGR